MQRGLTILVGILGVVTMAGGSAALLETQEPQQRAIQAPASDDSLIIPISVLAAGATIVVTTVWRVAAERGRLLGKIHEVKSGHDREIESIRVGVEEIRRSLAELRGAFAQVQDTLRRNTEKLIRLETRCDFEHDRPKRPKNGSDTG